MIAIDVWAEGFESLFETDKLAFITMKVKKDQLEIDENREKLSKSRLNLDCGFSSLS